jgi:hypothetical protein
MNKEKIHEAQRTYRKCEFDYNRAQGIENNIQKFVLTVNNYKIDPSKQHLNYKKIDKIRDPKDCHLMSESDFSEYLRKCHQSYIKHKPHLKNDVIYSSEERKFLNIAEYSLLLEVHEYMKQFSEYDLNDLEFKKAIKHLKTRYKMINLALSL